MAVTSKEHIRAKFNRAAASYDQYAVVQSQVAEELASLLPAVSPQPVTILEIGCGTGRFTRLLRHHFPAAHLSAFDFAPEMVAMAQKNLGAGASFFCADGEEYLACCEQRFDLIVSNANLQWFTDLPLALARLARCLQPHGQALLSLFGPDSLHCLAQALDDELGFAGPLPSQLFAGQQQLLEMVKPLFAQATVQRRLYRQSYGSVYQLLKAISSTGTGGYHQGLPRLTRGKMSRLEQWFARRHGVLAEYEVFFLHCQQGGNE